MTSTRVAPLASALAVVVACVPGVMAQEQREAERIVEEFFSTGNWAPMRTAHTCPGDDPVRDEIMRLLSAPRSEAQTRRLLSSWGSAAPCRLDEILAWYVHAARVMTSETDARALARRAVGLDSVRGAEIVYSAAIDSTVAWQARAGYQVGLYSHLSIDDQRELYLETFRRNLQAGDYVAVGMMNVFDGSDPAGAAIDVISTALEVEDDERGARLLGIVLSIVTGVPQIFGPEERQRVWAFIEPRLEGMPPERREVVKSYERELRG